MAATVAVDGGVESDAPADRRGKHVAPDCVVHTVVLHKVRRKRVKNPVVFDQDPRRALVQVNAVPIPANLALDFTRRVFYKQLLKVSHRFPEK
jgi:hypothetical protein